MSAVCRRRGATRWNPACGRHFQPAPLTRLHPDFQIRLPGRVCRNGRRNYKSVPQQVRALTRFFLFVLLLLLHTGSPAGHFQFQPVCSSTSGLRKPGRKTPSPSTPATTAAASTTRATFSERLTERVSRRLPSLASVELREASRLFIFNLAAASFPPCFPS